MSTDQGGKGVSEITREKFEEMLNLMTPCRWRGFGDSFESFHMSEALHDDVVRWFCRLRTVHGEWFYTLDDSFKLTQHGLRERIAEFIKAQPLREEFTVEHEGTAHTFTRKEALATIWRHTHADYRGTMNGCKTILVNRGGTCLVGLDALTDEEIADKLRSSIRHEVERRAKR